MYWLIETEEQLQELVNKKLTDVFVEIIPYNNNIHPKLNHVSCIYLKPLYDEKGYMLCINHSETLSINITVIERLLKSIDTICTRDKKALLYYFPLKNILDISFNLPEIPNHNTQAHDFFYSRYSDKSDINRIIPVYKHYEYCEDLYTKIEDYIATGPNFYDKAALAFFGIEKNGIKIDVDLFNQYYETNNKEYSISDDIIYTQYNLLTTTKRPSNTFNNINFAALNKDNGGRMAFIPRNDQFVEIDISAYHPTLAAKITGYDFGDKDIHQSFAEMYGVDYKEAKQITFRQLYGGIYSEYKDLPFFKKVQEYVDHLWDVFNTVGYIECPLSNYRFYKDNLPNMSPQKLFNYLLQNLETSQNVLILLDIHKLLRKKNTKIVLYTYDSFLLDIDKDELDILEDIKTIFNKLKLQIKISYGNNYDF